MKHFIRHVRPSKDRKVLLLLDNHSSHLSINALKLAKENGIIMLSFPPHCSHKLQPLDRSVFGPFKSSYNSFAGTWMREHPGAPMAITDIAGITGQALPVSATPANIVAGFRVSGISPFNPFIFDNEFDYAPSYVSDRPIPSQGAVGVPEAPTALDNAQVLFTIDAEEGQVKWIFYNRFVQIQLFSCYYFIRFSAFRIWKISHHWNKSNHCRRLDLGRQIIVDGRENRPSLPTRQLKNSSRQKRLQLKRTNVGSLCKMLVNLAVKLKPRPPNLVKVQKKEASQRRQMTVTQSVKNASNLGQRALTAVIGFSVCNAIIGRMKSAWKTA